MNWFKRLFTRRRVLVGVPLVLLGLLVFGLWAGLRAQQVYRDLQGAESSAREAVAAAQAGDEAALDAAVARLRAQAARAADRTSGPTWSLLGAVPFVGDDARGVAALSQALHLIGEEAADPLLASYGAVRELNQGGRINLTTVRSLGAEVPPSRRAVGEAARLLHGVDSAGFVTALKSRYESAVEMVDGLGTGLRSAELAARVLPDALGGAGEKTYLMVFLNNAEIRTSGGMPGAFAEVSARNGTLTMVSQGGPGDLGAPPEQPVLPLSKDESGFFGEQLGVYFQDANFIQDMPRASALMAARWKQYSGRAVDGVITLDTVGMSYLLDGAGAVSTPDGVRLSSANAVSELLNRTYLTVADPTQQDARFAAVAQSTFAALTTGVRDQTALARGLGRAVQERRLQVHLFDPAAQAQIDDTRIAGHLTDAPAGSPEVDLGFDDVTASKMSYYLRYRPSVRATSCVDDVQQLSGEVEVTSDLTPELAGQLPVSIVNDGRYGTAPGDQMVMLRIYGPLAGTVGEVRVDGEPVEVDRATIQGRPAASLALLLGPGQTSRVTWVMESGAGQRGPVDLRVTPGIEPGSLDATEPSGCA